MCKTNDKLISVWSRVFNSMSVKCEILSEDVFKAKNAYLRPFMAITLVIMGMSRSISQVFPDISQYFRYFPVFPGISQYRYFPRNCQPCVEINILKTWLVIWVNEYHAPSSYRSYRSHNNITSTDSHENYEKKHYKCR